MRAIFRPDCFMTILAKYDQKRTIAELVKLLARSGRIGGEQIDELVVALLDREEKAPTALGRGLAFPHLRTNCVHDFVGAIGLAPSGVDFQSLDGSPTRLILLLLSPFEERHRHCLILSRLATLLSNSTLEYSLQAPRDYESLRLLLEFS